MLAGIPKDVAASCSKAVVACLRIEIIAKASVLERSWPCVDSRVRSQFGDRSRIWEFAIRIEKEAALALLFHGSQVSAFLCRSYETAAASLSAGI